MSDRCPFWNLEEFYLLWACILTWHSTNWEGFEITSLPLSRYSQKPSNAIILFQYQTKHSPCTQQAHGSSEKFLVVTLHGPLIRCGREVQEQLDKRVWHECKVAPAHQEEIQSSWPRCASSRILHELDRPPRSQPKELQDKSGYDWKASKWM